MIKSIIAVAFGGAIGSVLRYLISVFFSKFNGTFPWATFSANLIGCLFIGLIVGFLQKNNLANSALYWLLVTGFCGGFTTFSTFGIENVNLINSGQYTMAVLYTMCSILLGITLVFLGFFMTKSL